MYNQPRKHTRWIQISLFKKLILSDNNGIEILYAGNAGNAGNWLIAHENQCK